MTEAPKPAGKPTGKAIAGFVGALAVAAAVAGGAYAYTTQYAYVAKVNGQPVPMGEFQRRLSGLKLQYASQMGVNFQNDAGKQVLTDLTGKLVARMTETTLIRQEAKKMGIEVAKADIDKEMADIVQNNFGGDKSKLEARVTAMQITMHDVEEQITDGLYTKRIVEKVAGSDKMTEAEALTFYTGNKPMFERQAEVQAAHILVPTLDEAKKVQAELKAGGDFAALAKKYSKDPGSAAQGGELGAFSHGKMVKPFEEAAFSLPIGQVSEPVKTQFGYHLIKVLKKQAPGMAPFAEVKTAIIEQESKKRQQQKFRAWLDDAKQKSQIKFAAGFEPSSDAMAGHDH